jgi:RNA ligase (TIGR02306 family)
MSSLIVEVCQIDKVLAHPNADVLELAHVKGWQCVVPKGRYVAGSVVTYIPIDSVLPIGLSDRLNITKYLSKQRVRCAKLRGEPSFGVIMDVEDPAWPPGLDVRERYGITKYEPPIRAGVSDAEPDHPLFTSYTDIENMRNFPVVIQDGEEVVATEKIHGTNCRVGLVDDSLMVAGSKGVRRKRPDDEKIATDLYWFPWSLTPVNSLVKSFSPARQVILFGEVYGKVQSLRYGVSGIAFRAFDLVVDGKYLDYDEFVTACQTHGVETVPLVYRGPFSLDAVKAVAAGNSTMPGAEHIREGVVVRPVRERSDPKTGRVILKYINDDYLFAKGISDSTDI